MSVLSEKLANGKPAFKDVTICLDGSLAGEREEAAKAVRVAQATDSERLASNTAAAARKALEAVDARVKAAAITIRITAVSFGEYNKFIIQNPPRKGEDESFNPQTFFIFVARRTGKFLHEGKMHDIPDEEWDDIELKLTDGDHDRLAQAVVLVNRQDSMRGIDFLSSNSGTTGSFSENSEPLEGLVSLTDD